MREAGEKPPMLAIKSRRNAHRKAELPLDLRGHQVRQRPGHYGPRYGFANFLRDCKKPRKLAEE
jgi:hypothetical protein